MQKSINRQSGFAIGTILLAVVLIAAIVSAIAIASRGTSNQGNREGSRVNASTIVQQGINLKNGFDRLISTGTDVTTITFGASDNTASNDETMGLAANRGAANFDARGNCLSTDPCLFNPTTGGASVQIPPTTSGVFNASVTAGNLALVRYNLRRNVTLAGVGTANNNIVTLLGRLSDATCRQLNVLSGAAASVGTNPPTIATAITISADEGGANIDLSAGQLASGQQEGCFENGTTSGEYYYFRVLAAR